MNRLRIVAVALSAVLLVAGCSGSSEPQNYDVTFDGVEVSGTTGSQPTIVVTDKTPATELGVKDLVVGDGAEVKAGDVVTVNYEGVALSSGETFDSSYTRGQPATFGLEQVIPGWSQGLVGMKEGGTRLLVIPGDLAYGENSPTPEIGPNETLVFVVDLISVQK